MTTVRVTYYGMDGAGRNVTEAKRDAGAKIERALSGSYTPEMISWRGWAILVYREPAGWCQRIVCTPEGPREGAVWGSPNDEAKEEAVKGARRHLAQLAWVHDDGADDEPAILKGDRHGLADHRSWCRFQMRYAEARRAGLSDHEAHAYGCGALGRDDLIKRVEGAA